LGELEKLNLYTAKGPTKISKQKKQRKNKSRTKQKAKAVQPRKEERSNLFFPKMLGDELKNAHGNQMASFNLSAVDINGEIDK
jgi:hypothetical protein